LLGLEIGSSRDDAVLMLGRPQGQGNGQEFLTRLGYVYGDLVPKQALAELAGQGGLTGLSWHDEQVNVVLHENAVRLVLVAVRTHRAASGRGIRIGDTEGVLIHAYADQVAVEVPARVPQASSGSGKRQRRTGKIYRYDNQGIAYEVENEKVTAIALYPPVQ
jgi:hypothetical protein